jgi:hypothetical protein
MSQKKNLSIGTIREVTIEPKDGEAFTKLEISLRQDVEIYVKGEKVDFSSFSLKDGTELKNKKIDITPVEIAQEGAKKAMDAGRMTEEMYNDLVARNERQNVRYNLSVSSRNLA